MVNRFAIAGIEIDDRAVEIAAQYMRYERAQQEKRSAEMDAQREERQAADAARQSWVYLIRIGQLVKIGTTVNLNSRFSGLRPNEVLVLLPGGYDDESALHRQFADLRAAGEYFHPGPALQHHIVQLREEHGAPKWTRSVVPDGRDWFTE